MIEQAFTPRPSIKLEMPNIKLPDARRVSVEGKKGVGEWTEKAKRWFNELKSKLNKNPRKVILDIAKTPEFENRMTDNDGNDEIEETNNLAQQNTQNKKIPKPDSLLTDSNIVPDLTTPDAADVQSSVNRVSGSLDRKTDLEPNSDLVQDQTPDSENLLRTPDEKKVDYKPRRVVPMQIDKKSRFFVQTKKELNFTDINGNKATAEGHKSIVSLSSKRGEHGDYFLKKISDNEKVAQTEKYIFFKNHGCIVPKVFKSVTTEDGIPAILASDETESGKYRVLSLNKGMMNLTAEDQQLVDKIPQEVKIRLTDQILYDCEQAARIDIPSTVDSATRYVLTQTAYGIKINYANPEETSIMIIDFGRSDTEKTRGPVNPIVLENVRHAAKFCKTVLNQDLRISEGKDYYRWCTYYGYAP